ncbi:hypothetical protein TEA_003747 [Camellia sinensis var. sinensis]|uniref:Uncharacterized protein n=1 Tax=Camellia sinensis var. sinensis TaxID=542762 RepID=A0A4S4DLF4_CAMSN|nr:hypothetical protein TEA_003747 [Camellia sinensis var. sinensis]
MDIRFRFGSFLTSRNLWSTSSRIQKPLIKPCCSSRRDSQQNDDDDDNNNNRANHYRSSPNLLDLQKKDNSELRFCVCLLAGDKFSTDWDKAWSSYRKQGKKTIFSDFSPNKYVTWNPTRSNYPLSEEVDPIKRTERSNLMLWTSPSFTLAGAIIIVTFLLLYTILAPIK